MMARYIGRAVMKGITGYAELNIPSKCVGKRKDKEELYFLTQKKTVASGEPLNLRPIYQINIYLI